MKLRKKKKEIKSYPLWKDVKVSGLRITGKYLWAGKIKKEEEDEK